jgi:hypothetical protein
MYHVPGGKHKTLRIALSQQQHAGVARQAASQSEAANHAAASQPASKPAGGGPRQPPARQRRQDPTYLLDLLVHVA